MSDLEQMERERGDLHVVILEEPVNSEVRSPFSSLQGSPSCRSLSVLCSRRITVTDYCACLPEGEGDVLYTF